MVVVVCEMHVPSKNSMFFQRHLSPQRSSGGWRCREIDDVDEFLYGLIIDSI
jgi:hypothetical protein